ncbi:MAG: hypothetical protein RSA02_06640, partial [Bacteroidales bacterium]
MEESKGRKKTAILYIVIVVLCTALIFMFFSRHTAVQDRNESFAQGVQLKGDLDKLMDDYTSIKIENQDLSSQLTDRDSLIMANAEEINRLIASQADYSKIKKKLELLRKITQDYVQRIDSLVVVNQELSTENVQIKHEISQEREKNTQLSQDKEALQEKVTVASAFKAYNLVIRTVRLRADGKEVPTDKSRRLDRVCIEFTLGENTLVGAGPQTIYARISRPDGVVLTIGSDDIYSFEMDGKKLQ